MVARHDSRQHLYLRDDGKLFHSLHLAPHICPIYGVSRRRRRRYAHTYLRSFNNRLIGTLSITMGTVPA